MTASPVTDVVPITRGSDGVHLVAQTRVPLDTVGAYLDGASAEEIALQYSSLQLADIYAVIADYLRHKSEIEKYLADRSVRRVELRREVEARCDQTGIRQRLEARRRPPSS